MDLNRLKNRPFNYGGNTSGRSDDLERSVAIIGMSAQIGAAANVSQFWDYLDQGCDMIRDFPAARFADAERLNQIWFHTPLPKTPVQAAYLDRVDQFDAKLHNIPPVEAEWMDPVQRVFLETAWTAIEDAGYSTRSLSGEKVAVNVGYGSSDNPYHAAMWNAESEAFGLAVSGNVDAMIAGRISYLLNLKGPAMVINTACSSSLAAVNTACRQLRNGDASMALVGGIKLILIPPDKKFKLGVEASAGRTRTLDEKANGTGRGEGAVCMLLKPYLQAKADKDHIYAVIRGTAANQDGASVGITAPNAEAQEMVIREAWQDAGIDPLTISYIEMHGTATKLGDTAEINGIERAYSNYTEKKQFCGVGSVKSNIGHLDGAAGMAGMLKAILMIDKKKMLPSLHFNSPNKNIDLISSPVYLNDRAVSWNPECGIRRCGVSSFGISGTNCHIVLEEPERIEDISSSESGSYLITASAMSRSGLLQIISEYQKFLSDHPECDLNKFSYTTNSGRNHYLWRFAAVIKDIGEFVHIDAGNIDQYTGNSFFDQHKVTDQKAAEMTKQADLLLMEAENKTDSKEYQCILKQTAKLYIAGANPNWQLLYDEEGVGRISIPGYPFDRHRHWHEFSISNERCHIGDALHPLIDECTLMTEKIQVFTKRMSTDNCWELKEHIINGVHVLPGTAIIEMAREAILQYTRSTDIALHQLTYHTPVMFSSRDEIRDINIVLISEYDKISVEVCSKNPETREWVSHAVLKGETVKAIEPGQIIEVEAIKERCHRSDKNVGPINRSIVKIDGNHWDNVDALYTNEEEVLVHFNMNETIRHELGSYYLHPGMLDPAVNAGSYLTNGTYLPFSFQKAQFVKKLPARFYSWIKRQKVPNNANGEFEVFDIIFTDEDGNPIGKVNDYVLKLVRDLNIYTGQVKQDRIFSEINWNRNDRENDIGNQGNQADGSVILLLKRSQLQSRQYLELKKHFRDKAVAVISGAGYQKVSEAEYIIRDDLADYEALLRDLGTVSIRRVIHMSSCRAGNDNSSPYNLIEDDIAQLKSAFLITKALYTVGCRQMIDFTILTNYAAAVVPEQEELYPGSRAIIGFGKCVRFEYGNLMIRAIDFDAHTSFSDVLAELESNNHQYLTAYRNGNRYTETLSNITELDYKTEDLLLREGGTYIIAGGFGGMGIELAKKMFSVSPEIKIILLSRSFSDLDIDKETNNNKMQQVCKIRAGGFKGWRRVRPSVGRLPAETHTVYY